MSRRRRSKKAASACSARCSKPIPISAASSPAASSPARVKPNQPVKVLDRKGNLVEQGRVSKILAFRGIERTPIDEAEAGDIVAIAGLEKFNVADTLCAPDVTEPLQAQPIDPPTLSMTFLVNDSPARRHRRRQGHEPRHPRPAVRKRPKAMSRCASRIRRQRTLSIVSGRGELQLAILIETMRREGFELGVSRPKVVLQKDEDGQLLEPIEEVVIDVDEEHSGVVVQKMAERKAEMIEMRPSGGDRLRLVFHAPTRGLIGYQGELLTDTRGTAIMNRLFHDYAPYKGEIAGAAQRRADLQRHGRIGRLCHVEARRPRPDDDRARPEGLSRHDRRRAYARQRSRDQRPERQAAHQHPRRRQGRGRAPDAADQDDAGAALAYIEDEELVEVTPKSIRLRKAILDPTERKRAVRTKESA